MRLRLRLVAETTNTTIGPVVIRPLNNQQNKTMFIEAFLLVLLVMLLAAYEKLKRSHQSQMRLMRASLIHAQNNHSYLVRSGQCYQDHQLLVDIIALVDKTLRTVSALTVTVSTRNHSPQYHLV